MAGAFFAQHDGARLVCDDFIPFIEPGLQHCYSPLVEAQVPTGTLIRHPCWSMPRMYSGVPTGRASRSTPGMPGHDPEELSLDEPLELDWESELLGSSMLELLEPDDELLSLEDEELDSQHPSPVATTSHLPLSGIQRAQPNVPGCAESTMPSES